MNAIKKKEVMLEKEIRKLKRDNQQLERENKALTESNKKLNRLIDSCKEIITKEVPYKVYYKRFGKDFPFRI